MSRVMLDEQSIPQKFWCHALDTATYIFSRIDIRRFINRTPYGILRNRNPSLEYFRVFDCKILSDSNNDDTSSDDDDFEDIEYVSLEEVNDVILREKLLNVKRLITNIKSLTENPTPDLVLKSSSSFPIPVTDSNSFFEKSDTSFSFSDNSLPKFETFSDQ
ncbi:hypothetical protein Tco_1236280 [Tanacetum coccineum]